MRDYGCTDGGCVFGHVGGMHTNGGCKCLDRRELTNLDSVMRARSGVAALRARIRWLERQVEALGGSLKETQCLPRS